MMTIGRDMNWDDLEGNLLPHWHMVDSVQVYDRDDHPGQWLVTSCVCPDCGHTWQAVAPDLSWGIECPACHLADLAWQWRER